MNDPTKIGVTVTDDALDPRLKTGDLAIVTLSAKPAPGNIIAGHDKDGRLGLFVWEPGLPVNVIGVAYQYQGNLLE